MVVYPSAGLLTTAVPDLEADRAAAYRRAYNNWLHDFCSATEGRVFGAASVDLRDALVVTTYVLIPEKIHARVRALLDEEEGNQFLRDMYPHVMEVFGREGWDDPAMDIYNDLDPRRQS